VKDPRLLRHRWTGPGAPHARSATPGGPGAHAEQTGQVALGYPARQLQWAGAATRASADRRTAQIHNPSGQWVPTTSCSGVCDQTG